MSTSTENLKIYVDNLPYKVDLYAKLPELFQQVGTVVDTRIIYGYIHDKNYAYVTMSTVEEVEKAINKFNGYELNGKILSVTREEPIREPRKPTQPRALSSSSSNIICIFKLPEDIENAQVNEMVSKHGKVEDLETIFDARFGETNAYVIMNNETDMNHVIAALNGYSLDGGVTKLQVFELRPKNTQ